jgi:hypothetical protein
VADLLNFGDDDALFVAERAMQTAARRIAEAHARLSKLIALDADAPLDAAPLLAVVEAATGDALPLAA